MAFCVPEDHRERAVKEVAQVYELIKMQQPLLLLHCSSSTQLAQSLLSEALRALNVALSVMTNQQPSSSVVKAEPSSPSPGAGDHPAQAAAVARSSAGNNKRRRRSTTMEHKSSSSSSWAGLTTVPYDDGYEWRKYGEKKINGTSYSRSYFRCTYKDDTGCLATKYVQQKDTSSDPPVFHVTYNNKHTCTSCSSNNNCTTTAAASMMNNNNIKQEPPATTMPPLVDASTLPFDDQTTPPPCHQEPSFPIPSTTSTSSISGGESCDEEYSPGAMMLGQQIMAAEEASASAGADDYLSFYDYDVDLLLLCDSFKDY